MSNSYWTIEYGSPALFLKKSTSHTEDWTTDVENAMRFQSEQEAHVYTKTYSFLLTIPGLRICEHMDVDGKADNEHASIQQTGE